MSMHFSVFFVFVSMRAFVHFRLCHLLYWSVWVTLFHLSSAVLCFLYIVLLLLLLLLLWLCASLLKLPYLNIVQYKYFSPRHVRFGFQCISAPLSSLRPLQRFLCSSLFSSFFQLNIYLLLSDVIADIIYVIFNNIYVYLLLFFFFNFSITKYTST